MTTGTISHIIAEQIKAKALCWGIFHNVATQTFVLKLFFFPLEFNKVFLYLYTTLL